ncbi:hypothetical protein K2X85_06415 [bacterium]|jgi:hypothetical protein|nr:hypothetical protein [bacterium]
MTSPVPLTPTQLRGIEKIGDIHFPGDGEFPSFSRLGCAEHAGFAISLLPEDDRSSLLMLLSVVGSLPRGFAWLLVQAGERGTRMPGPLGVGLRFLRLGLKGLATSLYYSGEKGTRYTGLTPLDLLSYQVQVYTQDKVDESVGSIAACRHLSS